MTRAARVGLAGADRLHRSLHRCVHAVGTPRSTVGGDPSTSKPRH